MRLIDFGASYADPKPPPTILDVEPKWIDDLFCIMLYERDSNGETVHIRRLEMNKDQAEQFASAVVRVLRQNGEKD